MIVMLHEKIPNMKSSRKCVAVLSAWQILITTRTAIWLVQYY